MSKQFKIVNPNVTISCKTRVAYNGDTVSADEVMRPGLLEALADVGKIEEVKSKSTKKSVAKKPEEPKVEEKSESKPVEETVEEKSLEGDKGSKKKAKKKKRK